MISNALIDAESMRSIYVTRWSAGEAAKIADAIIGMVEFAHGILGGDADPLRAEQVRQLEWWARTEYLPQLDAWSGELQSALQEFAGNEAEFQINALNDQLRESAFISTIPAAEQIAAAALSSQLPGGREILQDAFDRYGLRQYNLFMGAVRDAFSSGATSQELAKKLYGGQMVTNYRRVMGLGAITRAQAQTLASTSVANYSTATKQAIYQEHSDVVIGIKWLSTLDSKTSRQCRALDGQEFRFKDNPNPPMPPAHFGCRSTTILLLQGRYALPDEGGTRPAVGAKDADEEDGYKASQHKTGTNYYEWLKNQPKWFQDEALGPETADIFRNAGLTPEGFRKASVDGLYRPLTIEEMAASSATIRNYINRKGQ